LEQTTDPTPEGKPSAVGNAGRRPAVTRPSAVGNDGRSPSFTRMRLWPDLFALM